MANGVTYREMLLWLDEMRAFLFRVETDCRTRASADAKGLDGEIPADVLKKVQDALRAAMPYGIGPAPTVMPADNCQRSGGGG